MVLGEKSRVKDITFFRSFAERLKQLQHPFGVADNSIRLCPDGTYPFTFYDRLAEDNFFESHEIPTRLKEQGYLFGFLAECRSETLFCDIMNSVADDELDILIMDSDEQLFRPGQVDPKTIVL